MNLKNFAFKSNELLICWINLDQWHTDGSELSTAENSRAAKLLTALDRRRFTAARSALRTLIASFINTDPRELAFTIDTYGKPHLKGNPALQFSLTHCGPLAGIAMSTHGAVGLDCERLTLVDDMTSFCRRICSSTEWEIIRSLKGENLIKALFQIWTRKEAILKAIGVGLYYPLRKMTVLDRNHTHELHVEIPEFGPWWISTIDLPVTYAAACCAPFSIGAIERIEIPTTLTPAAWSQLIAQWA